jgi:hypothetical protein
MKGAADAVELVIATLKETLAEGETVKFSGFGTFLVRKRAERKGRDLKTGMGSSWTFSFLTSNTGSQICCLNCLMERSFTLNFSLPMTHRCF